MGRGIGAYGHYGLPDAVLTRSLMRTKGDDSGILKINKGDCQSPCAKWEFSGEENLTHLSSRVKPGMTRLYMQQL
jgi:hypothetical protein